MRNAIHLQSLAHLQLFLQPLSTQSLIVVVCLENDCFSCNFSMVLLISQGYLHLILTRSSEKPPIEENKFSDYCLHK